MRVLLTSAGLENRKIQECFMNMAGKDMAFAKALFIPTAAVNPGAIEVLPKCMNDLRKCGIKEQNITVCDLHAGMDIAQLREYDIVYLCGGDTYYLIKRINDTGFNKSLMEYVHGNGLVVGVSAGSLIFSNSIPDNLGLIDTKLDVHCATGEERGKLSCPLKDNVRLTDSCALAIRDIPDDMEVIGE